MVGNIVLTLFIFIYYKYDSRLGKTDQGARNIGALIYDFDDAYIAKIAPGVSFMEFIQYTKMVKGKMAYIHGKTYHADYEDFKRYKLHSNPVVVKQKWIKKY